MALSVGLVIGNKVISDEALSALRGLCVRVLFEAVDLGDWTAFMERLNQLRPDVVLVELARLGGEVEEAIRKIRRAACSPAVVVVHTEADPDSILRTMRAGAREYLCPPFQTTLAAALGRIQEERQQQRRGDRMLGKVVGFLSAKGGCGATTLACHMAVEVQRIADKDVLLADFDLDNGLIGFLMNSKSPYTVLDAMAGIHRLDLSYWKALVSNGIPGLEVMRAPDPVPSRPAPEHEKLRHVLQFARAQYAHIVVDLGRGLTRGAMSALDEVDETYLVTTLDVPSLHQAQYFTRLLHASGYKGERLKLVLNRVTRNTDITSEEVAQLVGAPVAAAFPDDYQGLYEAHAERTLLAPTSPIGRQISRLAAKILGMPDQAKKRKISIFG
jgi:pilus assembly protein CpaE